MMVQGNPDGRPLDKRKPEAQQNLLIGKFLTCGKLQMLGPYPRVGTNGSAQTTGLSAICACSQSFIDAVLAKLDQESVDTHGEKKHGFQ
jgi:hypothetical protein